MVIPLQLDPVSILVFGASFSALLALVAIGFTLIFGVGGVLNFAHGGFITLGAFAAYQVVTRMGLSPWIGLVSGLVSGAIIGGVVYLGVVQFREDQPVTLLILTFVIGFFIANALRIFLTGGSYNRAISVAQPLPGSTLVVGVSIPNVRLLVFGTSWIILAGVFYAVNYTKTGKAMLATAMTKKGAALVGIDSKRINLLVWVLAGAFAGLAGVFLTMLRTGSWIMGIEPLIISFAIVIMGGLGSIKGSVVGAYIIGFIEIITTSIDTSLSGLASLILLVVFLLLKPEGLFGREAAE